MASIAELNVRIGTNIKGLEAGLKSAESALRKSSNELGSISTQLSSTLSLAFAGIGVGALKSFGDIEKLQKGLEAQMGSAEAARAEMDKIREAAKKPGLGFEQFVKGSLQLQAVGDTAEKARNEISVFGNALALAGRGAGELDGVVTALTQIKSKGKVMAQEINQIAERLPQIRPAMLDAFGTANSEEIQKMGITATQFVDGITESLAKLPKAGGSFSNDVTNAFDNVKQGAATLGESINANLRVGERLTALSEWVISAASDFGKLSGTTQRWVLGVGLAAAAMGPAIKAGSALVQVGGAIGTAWTKMTIIAQQWAVAAANPETKTGVIAWWKGLNTVMKANIIGVTIGVVLALGAAFVLLRKDMSDAAVAQRSVNEVQKKAADSIAGQKSEVEGLVKAYNTEGATLNQKKNILDELKRLSPEYFGTLKVGKGDVEAITAATAAYTAELLKVAKVTAAKDRLVEIEKALMSLNKTAEPSTLQTLGNAILSGGQAFVFAGRQAASYTDNLNSQKKTLETERDALADLVTKQTLVNAGLGNLNNTTKDTTTSTQSLSKAIKEVFSDVKNAPGIAQAIGDDADVATIKALESGIRKLVDAGLTPASNEVQNLKSQLDALKASVVGISVIKRDGNIPRVASQTPIAPPNISPVAPPNISPVVASENIDASIKSFEAYTERMAYAAEIQQQLTDGTFNFQTALSGVSDILLTQGNLMGGVFVAMGDAIAQTASSGAASLSDLGKAAAGAAAKIIRSYIQQGVAAAVSKALAGVPFPFNIAAGAAAGGIAAALFTKVIGAIGVKGFARGTNYAPGGMALVGEQGAELVNLPRGSQVTPSPKTHRMITGMGGGANINLGGEFTVRGTDLVLVLERSQRKNERFR